MYDYSSHFLAGRDHRIDPYAQAARPDGGFDAARMLRVTALLGIATRLFYIYASANRISVSRTLLGLAGANGQLNLSGLPADGPAALALQAHDADTMVTMAVAASLIVLALFIVALISLGRRGKRGDATAAAVNKSRAVRLAGRSYLLVALAAIIAANALRSSPGASTADRLHTLLDGDAVTIGLQIAVIAILLVIALATGREIRKAANSDYRGQ
jgi:heme/copper-type cytochrome/quinol oxidase subunit 2